MDFGNAFHLLKDGKKVSRAAWSNAFLMIPRPGEKTVLGKIHYVQNDVMTPWMTIQQDIMEDDWEEGQ